MEFCVHLGRPRVAYNLFDEMPESNGLYKYGMLPKNMTAQHVLLHFLFDPGSTNGLIFERGAVQSWFNCLNNEPATIRVFVAALASSVEAGHLNLIDQMFDKMPHYRSKVIDPGPSSIILVVIELYSVDGHSKEDHLFDECPTLVESRILSELHSIKDINQDSSVEIGPTIAFQVNFMKQLICDVDWRGKIHIAPRFTQLQIATLWIHACNWIDTEQRLVTNFIYVSIASIFTNLEDACVFANGKSELVVIGCDIAGLCCVGLNSQLEHNVFRLEWHVSSEGFDFGHYIYEYGTLLFFGFHSRGPPVTSLAQVRDVLVESNPCEDYDSWMVYVPKGKFLSSIGPKFLFKYWERYTGLDSVKVWRKLLDAVLSMLADVVIQSSISIQVACRVYTVTGCVEGETLTAVMLHGEMVGGTDSITFDDAPDISYMESIITEPTAIAISYGLPTDVIAIDLDDKVAHQSVLDFERKLGKDFISKPIVPGRTQIACEGKTGVASINKCFKGAFELYNLMKLVGYHPYARPFVSVINLCLVLVTNPHGQQIHFDDISTGAIYVVAIVRPLLIIYSTSGSFDVAARDFDEMEEADIVLCIALISVYGISNRHNESVLMIFVATLDCIRDSNVNATSGSGKRYVGSLIERLCIPNKWLVFLCILHTRTLQLRWLRNQISLVTEDPALIPTTLLENNLYGIPDAATIEAQAFVFTAIVLRNDEHTLISNVYMFPIIVATHVQGYLFFFGQDKTLWFGNNAWGEGNPCCS